MTDLLAHLSAPTPKAAPKAAPAATKAVTTKAGRMAAKPSDAILARLHKVYAKAGELRAVFGITPDRTAAITARLDAVGTPQDGTLIRPELAAVAPITTNGVTRMVRASDGKAVGHGVAISAPTAGSVTATKAAWVIFVGYGLDGPTPFALTQDGDRPTYKSDPLASVTLTNGMVQSVAVSVRVPKSGDHWSVNTARFYSGGKLPDSDAETVALAALDAGERGEAAVIDAAAVLTGAKAAPATRAAGRRSKVTTAKRASVK